MGATICFAFRYSARVGNSLDGGAQGKPQFLNHRAFMPHPRRIYATAKCLTVTLCLWMGGLGASTVRAQNRVTLAGQVTVDGGGAVASQVTLQIYRTSGEMVDQYIVRSDGRFEFPDLDNVLYHLHASAQGYQLFEKDVDLSGSRHYVYMSIVLVPLTKVKTPAADLPALSDERAPKKAHKEYEKGSRALEEGNLGEALKHLRKAVSEFPCYSRAQTDLALMYIDRHEVAPAETALRKSLECDADFLKAYERLGILLNGTQRFAESEKVLKEGLRRAPNSWSLHYQLGAAYYGLGQYSQAEKEYSQVRSLNSTPPAELHVRLADLYHRLKEYDRAYWEMQAYLDQAPNGFYAARTRTVMQEMKASGLVHSVPGSPPPPQDH
jgi:tetratricopeptide (TPR) repeat protein